jgi:hypothetical protein
MLLALLQQFHLVAVVVAVLHYHQQEMLEQVAQQVQMVAQVAMMAQGQVAVVVQQQQ